MGWNVHSTPWNVYSSPWNVRSASRNIKLRYLQREYHPAAKPNVPRLFMEISMPTDAVMQILHNVNIQVQQNYSDCHYESNSNSRYHYIDI